MSTQPEDDRIPGSLFIYDEDSHLRNEFSVRLDPGSGIIHPNEYIPRDAYDWVSDSIFFRSQNPDIEAPVEEGARVDFEVMDEELARIREAWAEAKAKKMDGDLPNPSEHRTNGPRL